MYHNLFKYFKLIRLKVDGTNYEETAGTDGSPVNSEAVDTLSPEGVAQSVSFILTAGAIVATGTIAYKLQSSPDNSVWTDITGAASNFVAADTLKQRIISVYKPPARYVRAVTQRATANGVVDALHAILGHFPNVPPATHSTTAGQTFVSNP